MAQTWLEYGSKIFVLSTHFFGRDTNAPTYFFIIKRH